MVSSLHWFLSVALVIYEMCCCSKHFTTSKKKTTCIDQFLKRNGGFVLVVDFCWFSSILNDYWQFSTIFFTLKKYFDFSVLFAFQNFITLWIRVESWENSILAINKRFKPLSIDISFICSTSNQKKKTNSYEQYFYLKKNSYARTKNVCNRFNEQMLNDKRARIWFVL